MMNLKDELFNLACKAAGAILGTAIYTGVCLFIDWLHWRKGR